MSALTLTETRAALEEDVAAALGSRYAWALHTEPVKRAIDVAADLVFVGEIIRESDEFWQKWVYPEGMTAENVRNELADFHFMMEQVSKIYMHLTGGLLSKQSYYAGTIIAECDEHITRVIEEAVEEETKELRAELDAVKEELAQAKQGLWKVAGHPAEAAWIPQRQAAR